MDLVKALETKGYGYVIKQLSDASVNKTREFSRVETIALFQKIRLILSNVKGENSTWIQLMNEDEDGDDIWRLLFELRKYILCSKYSSIDEYAIYINETKCSVYDYLKQYEDNEMSRVLVSIINDEWKKCINSANFGEGYAEFLHMIFNMVDQELRYFDWGRDEINTFLKENINDQLSLMLAVIENPKDSSGYAEFIWRDVFPGFLRYMNFIFDENILEKSDFYSSSIEICKLTYTFAIEDDDRNKKDLLKINRFQRHLLNSLEYLFPVIQNTSAEMAHDSTTPVDDVGVLDSADNTQSPPYSPQLRYREAVEPDIVEIDYKPALSSDELESELFQCLIQ